MSIQPYETQNEINFIRELLEKNQAACARYCRILLTVPRRWDAGVDVQRVTECAADTLAILRAMEGGQAL